jgi:hypothetical protein
MTLSHPGTVILLVFLLYLYTLQNNRFGIYALCITAFLFVIKGLIISSNTWDKGFYDRVLDLSSWFSISDSYAWYIFKGAISTWLFIPLLIFIISLIVLLIQKNWKRASAVFGVEFIIFWTSMVIFREGDATPVMEKYLHPLAVSLALSFLFITEGVFQKLLFVRFILPALAVVFIIGVFKYSEFYVQNKEMVQRGEAHYYFSGHSKVLIKKLEFSALTEASPWALPYETMVLSAMKKRAFTVNVKPVEKDNWDNRNILFPDSTYGTAEFLPPFSVRTLNPNYFQLKTDPYFADTLELNQWVKP